MTEQNQIISKLSYMIASSRPLQAIFSITQPLFAAFLALHEIPELRFLLLFSIGSICGMFSVFALNDLVDHDIDKKIIQTKKEWDIDSVFAQHPFTQGLISGNEQILWIVINGLIAAVCLYLLNPFALLLYFLAILLEAIYCKLALVSELKVILAGALVSLGALIGWFAAKGINEPKILFSLGLLFFAWEIGGRNIANDFSDIEQDKKLGIKTIASVYGAITPSRFIVRFAMLTISANILLGLTASLGLVYLLITTIIGLILLVMPAINLIKNPTPQEALKYFNKASLYPVFIFLTVLLVYLVSK